MWAGASIWTNTWSSNALCGLYIKQLNDSSSGVAVGRCEKSTYRDACVYYASYKYGALPGYHRQGTRNSRHLATR